MKEIDNYLKLGKLSLFAFSFAEILFQLLIVISTLRYFVFVISSGASLVLKYVTQQ